MCHGVSWLRNTVGIILNNQIVMKKFRFILLFAVVFVAQMAFSQAVIKFDTTKIDLGTFTESQVKTAVFEFTNTGDKPLVVHQAFSSCGCTVADFTKEPVQPNAKGRVVVTYNAKGTFLGSFKKKVVVRTNAQNGFVPIYIEGTSKPDAASSK